MFCEPYLYSGEVVPKSRGPDSKSVVTFSFGTTKRASPEGLRLWNGLCRVSNSTMYLRARPIQALKLISKILKSSKNRQGHFVWCPAEGICRSPVQKTSTQFLDLSLTNSSQNFGWLSCNPERMKVKKSSLICRSMGTLFALSSAPGEGIKLCVNVKERVRSCASARWLKMEVFLAGHPAVIRSTRAAACAHCGITSDRRSLGFSQWTQDRWNPAHSLCSSSCFSNIHSIPR